MVPQGIILRLNRMSIADFIVFFVLSGCWVERLKEVFYLWQVVAGPLAWRRDEKRIAKESFLVIVLGGAETVDGGGRTAPWETEMFDSTMGYPGEDLAA